MLCSVNGLRALSLCVLVWLALSSAAWCSDALIESTAVQEKRPNIILILADDLGYGDLGSYGQRLVATPSLDQLAKEGMRFSNFYAGSTVCAPSRCVLMTGLHTGHAVVRGNGGAEIQTLSDSSITIAEVLSKSGYRTGLVGKWGLGEEGSTGHPLKQGFDFFYGFLNQTHAHNHYPEYLWRNLERETLANEVDRPPGQPNSPGGHASKKVVYANSRFQEEAIQFIDQSQDQPFFLYLALTLPHANNEANRMVGNGSEVPSYGAYADKPWKEQDKGFAAMVDAVDQTVGLVMKHLQQKGLDESTLVLFSSDNGPHNEANHDLDRFQSSGPLKGIKRALYDGGIRVPMLARWPGRIAAGSTSDLVSYQGDLLPTLAELAATSEAKAIIPQKIDGVSLAPTLLNQGTQLEHRYLYWEFYEQGSRQAVRFGDWKAIREPMIDGKVELYNVAQDIGEKIDVSSSNPNLVREAIAFMDEAHVADPNWQVPKRHAPRKNSGAKSPGKR